MHERGGPSCWVITTTPRPPPPSCGTGGFHTGDLARIDEDGYIYLTGRKNNLMILPSGENVSPEELEAPAGQDPRRAGGAGAPERRPHLRLYFLPARLPGPGAGFYPCHQPHAALYKRIAAVEFTDQPLPRNALGKIQRD